MTTTSSTPRTSRAARAAGLAEKSILGVIAGAAAAIGLTELVLLVIRIIGIAGGGPTLLTDVPLPAPLPLEFAAPAGVTATATTVDLAVDRLPDGALAALVAADAAGSLRVVGIAAAIAWLCLRVFLRRPFVRSATWAIGGVAILIIAVGMIRPLLTGIANAEAASALGIEGLPPLLVVLDLAPLAWGLSLAVVAAAFEIGQRLQRDTEGLV